MKRLFVVIAALVFMSAAAFAEKPVTKKESVTVKVTIDSIDHDSRIITFKDKDGNYEEVYAGPEVKRFDELKVGDKVTFKYTESVVFDLRKAGEPAPAAAAPAEPTITRNTAGKPGGTVTQQETVTVTVKAVDLKVPSVTVLTEDGRTLTYRIEDKGKLKNVNPGDRVVITFMEALLISVD